MSNDIEEEPTAPQTDTGDPRKRNKRSRATSNNDVAKNSRRRKPIYQTEGLEREKSPIPESEVPIRLLNGKRTVQCNICKRLMTESRLANHIRLLHVEPSTFATQDQDETNSSTLVKSETAAEATPQPPTTATTTSTTGKRKDFKCEYCGKLYSIQYTYQQHIKTHTEGRPKCPECSSTFATAFSLFRHRAKVHNLDHNYKTYQCDQCDKNFFSVSELKLHQRRHSSKKDFECSECQKAFSVKGNLTIHMRTHAKEKLYKCDICDSSFSHPYSLVSHRRIHTNDFPFKCPDCDKLYRSKHQLTSHLNVHNTNRPFKCTDCPKTFRSRTAFKMHQDEHKGIKRFSCKYCDRLFQCHANKLKHERRHSGQKSHKCEICEKAFFEKQELRNHLKVHAKKDAKKDKVVIANSENLSENPTVENQTEQ